MKPWRSATRLVVLVEEGPDRAPQRRETEQDLPREPGTEAADPRVLDRQPADVPAAVSPVRAGEGLLQDRRSGAVADVGAGIGRSAFRKPFIGRPDAVVEVAAGRVAHRPQQADR